MTPIERRALEQVKEAGRNGLQVQVGWESVTQSRLVELGHIWQEHGKPGHWKLTLSPYGRSVLDSSVLDSYVKQEPH